SHKDAYAKSVWGGVMSGLTGDNIRSLLAEWPKLLGKSLLTDPLLEGKPPEDLKRNLADLKKVSKILDLLGAKGFIVAAEIREPQITLKGAGQALTALLRGEQPGADALAPEFQIFIVVPDVADKQDILLASVRMLVNENKDNKIVPFEIAGRKGLTTNN